MPPVSYTHLAVDGVHIVLRVEDLDAQLGAVGVYAVGQCLEGRDLAVEMCIRDRSNCNTNQRFTVRINDLTCNLLQISIRRKSFTRQNYAFIKH